MAQIVITLPNQKTVTLDVQSLDDEIIPVNIKQCECGCEEWFNPSEPHQLYVNLEHQKRARPRKTDRRRKTA